MHNCNNCITLEQVTQLAFKEVQPIQCSPSKGVTIPMSNSAMTQGIYSYSAMTQGICSYSAMTHSAMTQGICSYSAMTQGMCSYSRYDSGGYVVTLAMIQGYM